MVIPQMPPSANWPIYIHLYCNNVWTQKVHTFQASLEAVLAQLCDAEFAQKSLTAGGAGQQPDDPGAFRNQLKVHYHCSTWQLCIF